MPVSLAEADRLLESDQRARETLADYRWFLHTSSKAKLPEIRSSGLQPKGYGLLCLNPLFTLPAQSSQRPPFIQFAVSYDDLPTVCIDGPFRDSWCGALNRATNDTIYSEFTNIWRNGSVATRHAIPVENLRIRVVEAPSDPETWPRLADVTDEEIFQFG